MKINAPDLFRGISLFPINCNHDLAGRIIQASRVNEHLCHEAEQGRVHGVGNILNGCWVLPGEAIRIKLHEGNMPVSVPNCFGSPFDRYPGGEPVIEQMWTTPQGISYFMPVNGLFQWNTQFIYLRASVFPFLLEWQYDSLGINSVEYQQAEALGTKWRFTGKYGDKNRLAEENWHYDDSLLTSIGDSFACHFIVRDARGCPQYALELFQTQFGNLLLPYRYLKRVGFWGARRVFFAPEENIAIWGADKIANPAVEHVILTFDPGLLLTAPQNGNVAVGCFPGGVESIAKSDLSVLKSRNCVVPILNSNSHYDVAFAVKLAAELRKKFMHPRIVRFDATILTPDSRSFEGHSLYGKSLQSSKISEIELPNLCALAKQHGIFIPEELQSNYHGDQSERLDFYQSVPVIPELFNFGDVLMVNGKDDDLKQVLCAHFAKSLKQGKSVFPEIWDEKGVFETIVFVDCISANTAKYLGRQDIKVCDVRFLDLKPDEQLACFRFVVGQAKVVIFAALDLWTQPASFANVIRWCREHLIAVIVIAPEDYNESTRTIRRMVSRTINIGKIDIGKGGITVAVTADGILPPVEAVFDSDGKLLESKVLSADKEDQVKPPRTVAAAPFNGKCFDGMKGMSPEEKFAAMKNGNPKLILPP